MSRPKRHMQRGTMHLDGQGNPKKELTREQAEAALVSIAAANRKAGLPPKRMNIFQCLQCGAWHIGRYTGAGKKQKGSW